jgi:hypothetical protein
MAEAVLTDLSLLKAVSASKLGFESPIIGRVEPAGSKADTIGDT